MLSNEIMVETRVADAWEYGRLLGIAHADMDPVRFELFWYMKYSRFFFFNHPTNIYLGILF